MSMGEHWAGTAVQVLLLVCVCLEEAIPCLGLALPGGRWP